MSKPQDDIFPKRGSGAGATRDVPGLEDEETLLNLDDEQKGRRPKDEGLKIAVNRPIAIGSLETPRSRQMSRIANQATQVGPNAPLPKPLPQSTSQPSSPASIPPPAAHAQPPTQPQPPAAAVRAPPLAPSVARNTGAGRPQPQTAPPSTERRPEPGVPGRAPPRVPHRVPPRKP